MSFVSLLKDRHTFLKENRDWTCHFSGKQLTLLTFETRLSKKIPLSSKALNRTKSSKFGACSGFLEVKNRCWSVAHPWGGGGGVMTLHDYGYLPPEFLRSYPVSE